MFALGESQRMRPPYFLEDVRPTASIEALGDMLETRLLMLGGACHLLLPDADGWKGLQHLDEEGVLTLFSSDPSQICNQS